MGIWLGSSNSVNSTSSGNCQEDTKFRFYRDDSIDGLLANMSFLLHEQEEDKKKVKDNEEEEEEWVTESDRDDKNEFATESDRNAIDVSSTISDTSPMMGRGLQHK